MSCQAAFAKAGERLRLLKLEITAKKPLDKWFVESEKNAYTHSFTEKFSKNIMEIIH